MKCAQVLTFIIYVDEPPDFNYHFFLEKLYMDVNFGAQKI